MKRQPLAKHLQHMLNNQSAPRRTNKQNPNRPQPNKPHRPTATIEPVTPSDLQAAMECGGSTPLSINQPPIPFPQSHHTPLPHPSPQPPTSYPPKTTRPRTPEQIRASQQNGKKSQGPKTAEGKSTSRKNALKHGLSSQDPAILPPNLQQEVAAEVELFTRDLKPQTHIEQRLVETAALSCVRFLRLSHAETSIAQDRARTAIPAWQAERNASVNHLIKTLDAAPPGKAPDALHALKQTTHGCRLLAARYQKLIDDLANNAAPFTLKHLETLARLEAFNGTMPDRSDTPARKKLWQHLLALMVTRSASEGSSRPSDEVTRSASEASDEGSPTRQRWVSRPSSDDAIVAHIAHHAFGETHETLALTLPDPDTARCKLIQYLSKRKHILTQRASHLWQTQDRPARDEAPSRALFDATPEGKLLARYMNDAQRTMRLALKELQKAQKARQNRAATGLQSVTRDPISEISNRKSQIPPIEPNTPQPKPDSTVTPVGWAEGFEAHQRIHGSPTPEGRHIPESSKSVDEKMPSVARP